MAPTIHNGSIPQETTMFIVKIIPNKRGNQPGKLADAELHFTHTIGEHAVLQHEEQPTADALLSGLKLIGFSVWERRTGGRIVTLPARQYTMNGERRSFALLRPITDHDAQESVRQAILDAYAAYEEAQS
jgi:hypothetical protein